MFTILLRLFTVLSIFFLSKPVYSGFWEMEGKIGVFIPSSPKMRHLFHTAMPLVEVEAMRRFSQFWDVWAGVGCIFGEGRSLGCGRKTTVEVIPFSFGVRRHFQLARKIDVLLGVGALWSLYRNRDHSSYVHQNISGNAFGALFKGEMRYRWRKQVYSTLFVEYMDQRFSFRKVYEKHFTYRHDVNMSGGKFGVGLVYGF